MESSSESGSGPRPSEGLDVGEKLVERGPIHEFHGDKSESRMFGNVPFTNLVLANFVDIGHVRMSERRCQPGLLHEAMHALRVRSQTRWQDLQSDAPAQPRIIGQIDRSHAAFAQARDYAVMGDFGTRY